MFYKKSKSQISSDTFNELAIKNVKKSLKNYTIYFITLVFGVMLLYTFNSIEDHIKLLGGGTYIESYIAFARGIMLVASVFICMIFGFLIAYANNFFIKRRKREFGVYTVLGMNKRDITKLMFKETLTIGAIALVAGLILGVFVSQGIRVITLNMMNIQDNSFRFSISSLAMIKTIIFFLLSLYFVSRFNKRNIEKHNLIDLLNADKKNEESIVKNNKKKVYLFILSIVLIALGYIIIPKDLVSSWKKLVLSIVLIGYGTYLFFSSISDFTINLVKNNKRMYYKKLNLFVVSQISSYIKTMNVSLTVICLLLFSSMVIIPFGVSMGKDITYDLKEATPFDATISKAFNEYTDKTSIADTLEKDGINFSDITSTSGEVNKYISEDVKLNKFVLKGFKPNKHTDYKKYLNDNIYLVGLSQYNQALKQQGLKEINLKDDEFAINYNSYEYEELYNYYIKHNKNKLDINGFELKLNQNKLYKNSINTAELALGNGEIIVPDKVVAKLTPQISYINYNYIKSNNKYENMFFDEFLKRTSDDISLSSKMAIDGEKIALNTVLTFIAVDLGIILIITAGAVLALHQIAQADTNKERFKLLKDMGASNREMKKALIIQVLITFIIPLAVAMIHFVFVSTALSDLIASLGNVEILKTMIITIVTTLIIYGIYFTISIVESLRSLEE